MSTPIWLKDPYILLKHDKLKDIWPIEKMTSEEKVNAVTRLVILLISLGYLLTLSYKIFYIGLVTLAIILVLYYAHKPINQTNKEKFTNLSGVYPSFTNPVMYELNKNKFDKPSNTNPLMNVLIPDIYYDPKKKPAAPSFNPTVEKEINKSVKEFIEKPFNDKNINKKLFADLGEEIMFNRSMLQWTSTADAQIPNDQKAFQEYLYGDMISGKEGNPLALARHSAGAYNYQQA
jgi:hypothetical protein